MATNKTTIFYKNLTDQTCLEVSTSKKCPWHSALHRFVGSSAPTLPQYFKSLGMNLGLPLMTAKSCPSVLSSMATSVLVKSPSDFVINVEKDVGVRWTTPNESLGLKIDFHPLEQVQDSKGEYIKLFNNKIILKITLPTLIKVSPTQPYIYLQPHYHKDLGFQVIQGPMPAKYAGSRGNEVTILYLFENETNSFFIKKGDVLAYLWGAWDTVDLAENTRLKAINPTTFSSVGKDFWK